MKSGRWIRGAVLFLAAVLCFTATGCRKYENPARMPFSSAQWQGRTYSELMEDLKNAGFVNIHESTRMTADQGLLGKVAGLTVDGDLSFAKGKRYESDAPINMTYYVINDIDPTMEVEVSGREGWPEFVLKTNLPSTTKLLLTLENGRGYSEQQTVTVQSGVARSEIFKDGQDLPLAEDYLLTVVTLPLEEQGATAKTELGENGKYMAGDLVKRDDATGEAYVFFEYAYTSPYKRRAVENYGGEYGDESSRAYMKAVLEGQMEAGSWDDYTTSLDGVIFTVNVRQEGLTETALLAQSGNTRAFLTWSQVKSSVIAANKRFQALLENNGLSGCYVVTNVLDDVNEENFLLSVMAGDIIADRTA